MKVRVVELIKPILSAFAIVLLGHLAPALAQESQAYIGAGGFVSTQGSHRQGSAPSLPTAGAGGTTVGVGFEAGAFLTPRIALGVEVSLPSRFTSIQETDYSRVFQQKSRHRDVALSGVVRTVLGPSSRLRVGLVAGGGVVSESTRQQRRDQQGLLPTYPPVFGPYSDEYSFTRWTLGALAGADIEMAIAPHVALVPQIRAHFIRRSSDPSEQGWALGLDTLVLRPALSVRTTF
jgi:outer membrane protein with beta-barrel domain